MNDSEKPKQWFFFLLKKKSMTDQRLRSDHIKIDSQIVGKESTII